MCSSDLHVRCVALEGRIGESVGCSIYTLRPSPCRDFEASFEFGQHKPRCDEARARQHPVEGLGKALRSMQFTRRGGLQEKVIDEHTKFHCTGSLRLGNRVYHCWKKEGHGDVNVVDALTKSCDVFFYRLAQKLRSVDDIASWAFHLGLGKKTDIALPRETSGLIPTEEWKQKRFGKPWTAGETLSVAIGQGYVLTTAIQLANTYASIANGGTLYRPFLIKKITTVDGERYPMNQGDLVLTPSPCWHDHEHLGTAPMIWLDILDISLVRAMHACFFEPYPHEKQPVSAQPERSAREYGSGLMRPPRRGPAPARNPLLT